jgi:hypothetical protein
MNVAPKVEDRMRWIGKEMGIQIYKAQSAKRQYRIIVPDFPLSSIGAKANYRFICKENTIKKKLENFMLSHQ